MMFCTSTFLGAHCEQPTGHVGNHVNTHTSGHTCVWTDDAADNEAKPT